MLGFNYKKSTQALNFFAKYEGGVINKMKALKLIWLSDRLHLRKYARPILNDIYFALDYGPVASNTKDLVEGTYFLSSEERNYRDIYINNKDKYHYESIEEFNSKLFSKTELDIMTLIANEFGGFTEFELSDESHKYPEWNKFENHLKVSNSSRFEMSYEDFFLNAKEALKGNLFNIESDSLEMSKELFLENRHIANLI